MVGVMFCFVMNSTISFWWFVLSKPYYTDDYANQNDCEVLKLLFHDGIYIYVMCLCICSKRVKYVMKYLKWKKKMTWIRKAKSGKFRRLQRLIWSIFRDQVITYGITHTSSNILKFHIFRTLGALFYICNLLEKNKEMCI